MANEPDHLAGGLSASLPPGVTGEITRKNKKRREEKGGPDCISSITLGIFFFGSTSEHFKPNPVGVQHLFAFVKFVYCESGAETITAPEREPFLSQLLIG